MKSGTHFHFKQFSVRHDKCAMKVGTDAVLLAAWIDVAGASQILDIGTGCGVIALMLAQRTNQSVNIEAVEIEKQAAQQAAQNFNDSPWPSKLKVHESSIQEFSPAHRFDLIVTNPPYFNRSLEPPDKRRHQVRHTATLNYEELLSAVDRLLIPDGRFNMILPCHEGMLFSNIASQYGLFCSRRHSFRTRKEKPQERVLLEFTRQNKSVDTAEILLYDDGLTWSSAYRALTADFYLKV